MRFLTFPALLAAALFSAVVVVPFAPVTKPDAFAFEVSLRSVHPGVARVYYDTGGGFNEYQSAQTTYPGGNVSTRLRLPLTSGRHPTLRFDPADRDGPLLIESVRITGPGRVLRALTLADLQPAHEIQSAEVRNGGLELVPITGARDPQLLVTFSPPLEVGVRLADLAVSVLPRAGGVFVVLLLLLIVADRVAAVRRGASRLAERAQDRPGPAVAVIAALAVVASAYPVVFLGKSLVSPNLGTTLLYDAYPTLPGRSDGDTVDVKGSDIGAVMWQHVPFSMVQRRALLQGELPLWNRYNALGVPLLAQGQSMFGDPLHFLVIAANGRAWAWDFKYLLAKWLFALGLGLSVLALTESSRANLTREGHAPGRSAFPLLAALLVALAAPFIGFFFYRLNHPAFFSVCYAPWPLYCWIRIAQAGGRRAIAGWIGGLMISNLALMNSGTAKEAYMLLVSMNLTGAGVLLTSAESWRSRAVKLAGVGWAGILFVLLTAPIWATFLTTLKQAYTGYNAASAFQIQPGLLLGFFDEAFYRPVMTEERTFNPSTNFLLLLGLLYFLVTLRAHFTHRAAMTIAACSLLPLALAFGLIPAAWIVQVPFLANVAHLDNTFSCVLIMLWTVLAGLGFAHAAGRLGTRDGRGDLVLTALLLGFLVFAWIGFRQAGHRSIFGEGSAFVPVPPGRPLPVSEFVWLYLVALLFAAGALAWALRRASARGGFTPALALVAATAIAVMLWRHGLHAPSTAFAPYVARPTTRADFHARSETVETIRATQAAAPSRGHGLHSAFSAGWTAAYGLESIHGPDALVNPWVRELAGLLPGVERIWDWRLYLEPKNVAAARPFLDFLNVRHYLDQTSERGHLNAALQFVKSADLDLYESPTYWPRAFFSDRVATYTEVPQLIERIKTGDGRPFIAVQETELARHAMVAPHVRDLAGRSVVAAERYQLTENTSAFSVRATGPGVVVLTEAYWPGDFRVEVNGRKEAILRVNHAFKGVHVPAAGEYRIVFRYVPKNFPRNLALCGLGAALAAGTGFLTLRRSFPGLPLGKLHRLPGAGDRPGVKADAPDGGRRVRT